MHHARKSSHESRDEVKELTAEYLLPALTPKVRTQIYLNRDQHDFVQAEAARQGRPIASVIRGYIAEKMSLPDEVWESSPLLEPTPDDPDFSGHRDGATAHDKYIFGGSGKRKHTRRK